MGCLIDKGDRAQRVLASLRAANKVLFESADEQELLNGICDLLISDNGYRFVWIGLCGEPPEKLVIPTARAGHEAGYLEQVTITWDRSTTGMGPTGTAIREGRSVVIRHADTSQAFLPWREKALKRGYQSVISLPLGESGREFGALTIYAGEPDAFDQEEVMLLEELAQKLTHGQLALRNTAKIRRQKEREEALHRILEVSLQPMTLEGKLDRVLEILFEVSWIRLERKGSIFLLDADGKELVLVSKRYLGETLRDQCRRVPLGHCLCGQAAANRAAIFKSCIDGDHSVHIPGMDEHGHYIQPILSNEELLGVLNLYVSAGHQRDDEEVSFIQAVSHSLATLIERHYAEEARDHLIGVVETLPDPLIVTNRAGQLLYCNSGAGRSHKCNCSFPGNPGCPKTLGDLFLPEEWQRLQEEVWDKLRDEGVWQGESVMRGTLPGDDIPVLLTALHERNPHNGEERYTLIGRNIRDQKRSQEVLRQAALNERIFSNTLIDNLPEVFMLVDAERHLVRWNRTLTRLSGIADDRLQHLRADDLFTDLPLNTLESPEGQVHETALRCADGCQIPMLLRHTPLERLPLIEGRGSILSATDISERKALELELKQQANTDPLTGIHSRRRIHQSLEDALAEARRYAWSASVILFDLDCFKQINDRFGHGVGDAVLVEMARRVSSVLRDADLFGRWGGEEFVALASNTATDEAAQLAERIRETIAATPIGPVGRLTASFGIAGFQPGDDVETWVSRADIALYRAKESGRNRVEVE